MLTAWEKFDLSPPIKVVVENTKAEINEDYFKMLEPNTCLVIFGENESSNSNIVSKSY
jgi:sulfur relay (sulfurtransferase) DsrC/TusE family protein